MSQAPAIVLALPCLQAGGTEYQTRSLADALLRDGWRVSLLVYFDEISADMLSDFRAARVDVRLLALPRSTPLPFLLRRLTGAFRATRADLIHVQYMAPGFTAILATRLAGCRRVLATVHQSADVHGSRARAMLRTAASMCRVFLCNSLATETSWFGIARQYDPAIHAAPAGHFTLHNGVDTVAIAEAASRTPRARLAASLGFNRSPVIGVVGRLRSEKGQEVAIRAMPMVLKNHPSAGLLLVGDGPDRERLQALSRDLGVADAVGFLGGLPREDVYELLGMMDALATPSLQEGFCLAAAEAMAGGVPVVASALPALEEVLDNGRAGILTPPGDARSLAGGLNLVLSDPELATGLRRAALERVVSLFSRTEFERKTTALHRAVLAK